MRAIAPQKVEKKGKEVIPYCYCAVFEVSSGDRPPPQKKVFVLKKLGSENYLNYPPRIRIHGTSSTTPLEIGRKTPSTTPLLEFTEPHRLPPLEIGPENSHNYQLPQLPPLRNRPERKFAPPPPIQFLDPPLRYSLTVNVYYSNSQTYIGATIDG